MAHDVHWHALHHEPGDQQSPWLIPYPLSDIHFRVSQEDLDTFNLTSVPLAAGSGYVAMFRAHHELHCLVRMRSKSDSLFQIHPRDT